MSKTRVTIIRCECGCEEHAVYLDDTRITAGHVNSGTQLLDNLVPEATVLRAMGYETFGEDK